MLNERTHNGDTGYTFDIQIAFWDAINLKLNQQQEIAHKYYDWFMEPSFQPVEERRHAQMLREALERPAFLDPVEYERSVDDLVQAFADTLELLRTGYWYNRRRELVDSVLPSFRYDDPYRSALAVLEDSLQELYEWLQQHQHELEMFGTRRYAAAAREYTKRRTELLEMANTLFEGFGIDPIWVPGTRAR